MSKYLAYIGALVLLVVSAIWYIQDLKDQAYDAGYDKAALMYETRLGDMKDSLEASNKKAIEMREKQIVAYQKALDLRNDQYISIDNELKDKLSKLEEFENEYAKDWFNTPIPDVYR